MRLIVKEYIAQLREKDELDILLSRIYEQKGFVADSQPKTGNRQFGVDIQMHNSKELVFFVVKQGNIDRKVWSSDANAVRQSLDEIKDVAINQLTASERKKKIKIRVASNGYIEEAVMMNWKGYIRSNTIWSGISVDIDFIGIDDIVDMVITYFFNENLFADELKSDLRKAMYFVGEGNYKQKYYERITDTLIEGIKAGESSKKKFDKACATLYLSSQMICSYAHEERHDKTAIMVSEYVIIRYWKYLLEAKHLGKERYIDWLIKFCKCYERWNESYCSKLKSVADSESSLPAYNILENRVQIYEHLGFLASYACYLMNTKPEHSKWVQNIIIGIINRYPQYEYAPYDSDVRVIIMIYRLLKHNGNVKDISAIMQWQARILAEYYRREGKYPAQSDSFEEAVAIEMKQVKEPYVTSAFWGYYLLLICIMDDRKLYELLFDFLRNDIKDVTKCVWFMRSNEELQFYDRYAMNAGGEGVEVQLAENYDTFRERTQYILQQYDNEKMSFDEYCFEGLEMIVCRYYGYIPRVKF